jgi:hypothetical protein
LFLFHLFLQITLRGVHSSRDPLLNETPGENFGEYDGFCTSFALMVYVQIDLYFFDILN